MKVRLDRTYEEIATLCFIWILVLQIVNEAIPRKMASNAKDNEQEVTRELLMNVRDKLPDDWWDVGRYLGLSEAEIKDIESDYHRNRKEAKLQMLLKWKEKNGHQATYEALADGLERAGKRDLAEGLSTGRKLLSGDKKQMLICELMLKYAILYGAVQPIPYIRDKLYCVDRVFVEGGIEYFVGVKKIGTHGSWSDLETYQNLFNDERVKSTRHIVEGEPGYGKSTLTLQLAYDWCKKIKASALSKVNIFILLKMRQLGGVKSIYKAIRQYLLPKDSRLTETDIKDIMLNSLSVVVVLDGFDEYPDRDNDSESDFISIIKMEMFQQIQVILTTRSSFLPKYCPPQTKRIKLTGFDDRARDQYIRKAVVSDDVEAATKIKRMLKENAVLAGLCQTPVFFVMLAHMSYESEQFQKFKCVTSFFRYMISCFHSHMKNKMKGENVRKHDLFEAEHHELDKIAFDGLSGKEQQIVWRKEELCNRLGQEFYNQYVSIGILVEEEVLAITDQPSALITEHVQYKTEVRFYHKLFCEWYAAHYLAEYASREDVTFDPIHSQHKYPYQLGFNTWNTDPFLKHLDPIDVQFLYRFACGLNPTAGRKIIEYLKKSKEGEKFAILCILEQEGNVENLLGTVRQLCSSEVQISSVAHLLLQRSTIQLLEIASSNEIPIASMKLTDCFQSVDLKEESLCLSSGLQLPRLDTLQELVISGFLETVDLRDSAGVVLDYSARCVALKHLKFYAYASAFSLISPTILLPQSFDDKHVLTSLHRNNCKVQWIAFKPGFERLQLLLNLQTGKWEKEDGQEMTDDEYRYQVRLLL